jgi:hypothetical protein
VKVTFVPFGTTIKPGAEGAPVFANEIQLEPASGSAQAGFREITWVALPLLFVVAVELASCTVSALAVIRQALAASNRTTKLSFFTFHFPR